MEDICVAERMVLNLLLKKIDVRMTGLMLLGTGTGGAVL